MPELSIILPWRNRPEIAVALERNAARFAAHDAELIVADCGGTPGGLSEILDRRPVPPLRWIAWPAPTFDKALALNLGAHAARSPRLLFLDADVILDREFLPRALRHLDRGGCFVTVDRVVETRPPDPPLSLPQIREIAWSIELIGRGGRRARIETNRLRSRDGSRSGPGLILLSKEDFLAVDGMNSDLEGWGWEDLDLVARLQMERGLHRRRLGSAVHLSHGDEVRDLRGLERAASEQANFSLCLANYNLGHFLGTYRDDAATWGRRLVEREIRP
jgi:glycosyltransferase involved in cell wall biosynthesis